MLFGRPLPPGNPPEPEGRKLAHAFSAAWNFEFPLPGAPAPELPWGNDGGVPLLPAGGAPPPPAPNPPAPDGRVTPCCFRHEVNAVVDAFVDDEPELVDVDVDEPEPDTFGLPLPHAARVKASTPTASKP